MLRTLTKVLKVFYPCGQAGRLPWRGGANSIGFGAEISPRAIPLIANQIRTFTERVDDDAMLDEMRGYIEEAEQVIYLGFSLRADEHGAISSKGFQDLQERFWNGAGYVSPQYRRGER